MKVNVRGIWYDAEEEPILVELNNSDKKNIANMSKEFKQYICFPANMDFREVELKLNLRNKCYKDHNQVCKYDCNGLCKESY